MHQMNINDGQPMHSFKAEIEKFQNKNADHPKLGDKVRSLWKVAKRVCAIALLMTERKKSDVLQWASYTYPALISISEVALIWRLLDMAVVAHQLLLQGKQKKINFYSGKILQATYLADIILPQTLANMENCLRHGREIIEIPDDGF